MKSETRFLMNLTVALLAISSVSKPSRSQVPPMGPGHYAYTWHCSCGIFHFSPYDASCNTVCPYSPSFNPTYNPLPALENQLSGLDRQKSALENRLRSLQQTNSGLQDQVDELNSEISNLTGEISDMQQNNAQVRREIFETNRQQALSGLKDIGGSARLGRASGGGTDRLGLKPLGCGAGIACRQLRSAAQSGGLAKRSGSPEEAKYYASPTFDTTGLPVSAGQPVVLGGIRRVDYRSLPLSTRDNPQFKQMLTDVAAYNKQIAHIEVLEGQLRNKIRMTSDRSKRGNEEVSLTRLKQEAFQIQSNKNLVRSESLRSFNVDVSDVKNLPSSINP